MTVFGSLRAGRKNDVACFRNLEESHQFRLIDRNDVALYASYVALVLSYHWKVGRKDSSGRKLVTGDDPNHG